MFVFVMSIKRHDKDKTLQDIKRHEHLSGRERVQFRGNYGKYRFLIIQELSLCAKTFVQIFYLCDQSIVVLQMKNVRLVENACDYFAKFKTMY